MAEPTNCRNCRFDWRDHDGNPRCTIIDGDGDPETIEAVEEWVADDDNVNHLGHATVDATGCPGWQEREGDSLDKVIAHAAQTDGAHHKQHDICAALRVLLGDVGFAALGIDDEGVPS